MWLVMMMMMVKKKKKKIKCFRHYVAPVSSSLQIDQINEMSE
jgi:hypothetical protein